MERKSVSYFITALTAVLLWSCISLNAQTVSVKDTLMRTYPYGDPDPVPQTGKIYPYWRFQKFTKTPENKLWKMVVLENKYLRVKVFPEIGGKVWSIYDKTGGKELFYDNDVVKFREIALRGPWTSGGIEFNYGVIGHAPSCSSPVDWKTETKEDGSVSCYIGVFEMLSRSHWTVEVNLPADAAYVRTSSIWHNDSSEYQPYYSWANSGVKVGDDVMFVYPSDNAIGHGGEKIIYPIAEDGKDISLYRNQAYGPAKSYHMVGSHKPFFSAYYQSEDRGVAHWSLRDEKLGRKFFSWAQSGNGTIWIDLLTDNRPQYIEMQSGKLFNQNDVSSSRNSGYRQILFSPYQTDSWSDFWLPYEGIGPADNITLDAVTSAKKDGDKYVLGIYPLRSLNGRVEVTGKSGNVLYSAEQNLAPARTVSVKVSGEPYKLTAAGKLLWCSDDEKTGRPQDRSAEFNPESSDAIMMMARDYLGMRRYAEAEKEIDRLLSKDPANVDALALKAVLRYHRMDYEGACAYADKALSIDQYNQDAGYIGGVAAIELGKYADAMDRLEVASISNGALRSSAFTELARQRFLRGETDLAAAYARKALIYNGNNLTAMYILQKIEGGQLQRISALNPLSHFPGAERLLKGEINAEDYYAEFHEEIPWEDYLELAVFYHSLGIDADAIAILEALPAQNSLTALWIAYMKGDKAAVSEAESCDINYVFPFRRESAAVLKWSMDNGGGWQTRYMLAMLQDFLGNTECAESLMDGSDADYAPYYAYRYQFTSDASDLRKALSIDPEGWRYVKLLAANLVKNGKGREAVTMLEKFYAGHKDNVQIGDALIDAYISQEMYSKAEGVVDTIEYLPFEGLRGSHDKYRHIKLHLAAASIDKGKLAKASSLVEEALLWPERLGVGKPYDNEIDTSVEDFLKSEIEARKKGNGPFEPVSPKLGNYLTVDRRLF